MITRIRPRPLVDLARRDLGGPVDVVNLITTARFQRYQWYALLVTPAMRAVGARLLWMSRLEESLHGEPQAEKLLVVRYPSQRHFLAMTLNPYYLTINRLRESGVSRFEASFTRASHPGDDLAARRRLIAVHFRSHAGDDALDAVAAIVGGELVYATRAVAGLGFLHPPRATDPNPLRLGELALFDARDLDVAQAAGSLAGVVEEFSLQSYAREPRSAYRPALRT